MKTGSHSVKQDLRCVNSVGKRRLGDLYLRNESNVKTVSVTTGLCDLVPAHAMKAYLGVAEVEFCSFLT
jgi:hypothetical protein